MGFRTARQTVSMEHLQIFADSQRQLDAALHIEGAAVAKPPQFDQCLAHRGQGDAVGFGEFSLMGKILFQRIDAGVDLGNKILCDLDIDRIVPI